MRRAKQCRYFARSPPPSKRHSRLTIVRRGCKTVTIRRDSWRSHVHRTYTAQRVQLGRPLAPPAGGAIPNPPQRNQNSPAPGPKPGGGAGAEGRAAAAAARDGAARAQGGAAEPRSGRAGFCPQRPPPSAKRGRRARLRGKADEGRGPPFRRDGAARIPKSADAIRRQHNERQRGGAGRDGAPHGSREHPPCTHSLRRELPSRGGSGGPIYRATTLPRVRRSSR